MVLLQKTTLVFGPKSNLLVITDYKKGRISVPFYNLYL